MSLDRSAGFERYRLDWKVWALWLAAFFLFSALSPRDAYFDVAHYHIHNGWSFWNGRLDQDLAPAGFHSFLNPLHSAIVWALVSALPGPIAIGLLSLVQGAVFPALYALLARLAWKLEADTSPAILLMVAFVGFACQPMVLMLSSVLNDHWGALAFVLALALLLPPNRETPSFAALGIGAGLVGAAFGMKLTNAVYVAGYAAAVLVILPDHIARLKGAAVCAAAGLVATLATGGWWAWEMYERFGNPIFPNLNSLFEAPLGPDMAFRDEKFLPSSFWDGLIRPFYFSFDASPINERPTRDLRLLAGYLACFGLIAVAARSWFQQQSGRRTRIVLALVAAFLATFALWTVTFSIQRYVTALYLIGPVMVMAFAWLVWPRRMLEERPRLVIMVLMAALLVTTSFERLRRVPWQGFGEKYVWTELPAGADVRDAIIIMSSNFPTAFTSTAFGEARLITFGDTHPWAQPALENYQPLIQSAIDGSPDPIFAVIFFGQTSDASDLDRLAQEYGLTAQPGACQPMRTAFDSEGVYWALCPLFREAAG